MSDSFPRIVTATLVVCWSLVTLSCAQPSSSIATSQSKEPESTKKVATERLLPSQIAKRLHKGIDVSHHSGAVNWAELVAEGHSFAVVKATEGVDLEDPLFADSWSTMKEAGLIRGAYHFYVTEDDPREQAQFFIKTVELEPGDLAPVVDVETLGHDTGPGLPQRLKIWLDIVENHYGVKPIIYTAWKFWNNHLTDDFGEYPLWVAEYEVEEPTLPAGWSEWHIWQWKGDADVPGVEKGADLSRVNHSGLDLSVLVVGH